MPSVNLHRDQAIHNENLARELLRSLQYRDWVITVSFYAAIHFVDSKLATMIPPVHPEKNAPRAQCSVHTYRLRLVRKYYGAISSQYAKLRHSAEIARYLGSGTYSIPTISHHYFSDGDTRNHFNDLQAIKNFLNL